MLLVVTGVGFLIHIYSVGYMAHEEGYWRYFAYLNLFMFFMLTLVLAENFLLMFVGWEGVGLASYLLIGFYYLRESAADAGKKAFILNRIGDFGFLLAMFLMIAHFGSAQLSPGLRRHHRSIPQMQGGFLTAIALLLVLGATGKSAQIPLYVWLPDAMEGPTPVSALIHAATMVTAGVYMIVRSHVLFDRSPFALGVVAIIGAATALFAATVGMVQTDIKRVLAYSTISQLGYMFLACGAAAYSAAIFHLVTHAFFKGLLFLAAGSVIHAMGGQQDMRAMGGLRKTVPITFWTMSAAVFAISGIPPFSGFFSKDAILYQAFLSPTAGPILWFVGLVTALLTAFYMFRLWYLTFFGETAGRTDAHPHESPWSMLVPLILLAVLALAGGWIGIPKALGGSDQFAHFLDPVVNPAPSYRADPHRPWTSRASQRAAAALHSATPPPRAAKARSACSASSPWSWRRSAGFLPICSTAASPAWPIGWSSASVVLYSAAGPQVLDRPDLHRAHRGSSALCYPLPVVGRSRSRSHRRRRQPGGRQCARSGGDCAAGAVGKHPFLRRVAGDRRRALLLITYFGFSMQL